MSEPEVTSGMIAAGVKVIAEEYGVLGPYEAEGLARDVFTAMMKEGRKSEIEESIRQLVACQKPGDREESHIVADSILCDLLRSLGYEDVVAEWEKVGKWYA